MIQIKFIYPSDIGHPTIESDAIPSVGDGVYVSGVRHTVKSRDFVVDHGKVERVDIFLQE